MKLSKLLSSSVIILSIALLLSCGENKEIKNDPTKEIKKETVAKIDLNTQEGYENVIKGLGITIFDGAVFKEVKKSDFYGNNIIEYSLPVGEGSLFKNAKQAEDSLLSFYKGQLEAVLIPNGWMVSRGGDQNRMMYIKTGKRVKMFTVSIFPTFKSDMDQPKKFLFNYSD